MCALGQSDILYWCIYLSDIFQRVFEWDWDWRIVSGGEVSKAGPDRWCIPSRWSRAIDNPIPSSQSDIHVLNMVDFSEKLYMEEISGESGAWIETTKTNTRANMRFLILLLLLASEQQGEEGAIAMAHSISKRFNHSSLLSGAPGNVGEYKGTTMILPWHQVNFVGCWNIWTSNITSSA